MKVIQWYYDQGRNVAHTAKKIHVDRKQIREWIKKEKQIQDSKKRCQKIKSGRTALFPNAETELHEEFLKIRQEGKAVKHWWFDLRMKTLVAQHYPGAIFKHSDRWFEGFCQRFKISLRKKPHVSQKAPDAIESSLKTFHRYLSYLRRSGTYQLADIANMDQTPLPFILDDKITHETTGSKDVCCRSGASGLDKRQATAHITLFADGKPRVKPDVRGLRLQRKCVG